jgi:hypothetical protein
MEKRFQFCSEGHSHLIPEMFPSIGLISVKDVIDSCLLSVYQLEHVDKSFMAKDGKGLLES